jgi:hypothetical protein
MDAFMFPVISKLCSVSLRLRKETNVNSYCLENTWEQYSYSHRKFALESLSSHVAELCCGVLWIGLGSRFPTSKLNAVGGEEVVGHDIVF